MLSILHLTTKPYLAALNDFIVERLPTGMTMDDLEIGPVKRMQSDEIRCLIKVKPVSYNKEGWSWYGNTEFKHELMDLSDIFQKVDMPLSIPVVAGTLTQTSEDIVDYLYATYGIHFDLNDYLSAEYNVPEGGVLEASVQSNRSRGQLTFVLAEQL